MHVYSFNYFGRKLAKYRSFCPKCYVVYVRSQKEYKTRQLV